MPTFSCYAGQALLVGMMILFGIECFKNGWPRLGVMLSICAMLTVFGWNCQYTMVCT